MDKVTRRALIAAAGVSAAGVALAGVLGGEKRPAAEFRDTIVAKRRGKPVPLEDPLDEGWLDATPVRVALQPQSGVPPVLTEGTVSELVVDALHDGQDLGLRLSWADPDLDDLDGILLFHDAVAVQLPARSGQTPPVTMGAPGSPVHILQWRASWQRDIEGHHQGVETLYPRVVRDEPPESVLTPDVAALFYVGRVVKNPLSALGRVSSVEEIVAEGFGSATALPEQRAVGHAVHDFGRWLVTIGLPLDRGTAGESIEPGATWPIAFAVWMGSKGNRGGRKHFADWKQLRLEA